MNLVLLIQTKKCTLIEANICKKYNSPESLPLDLSLLDKNNFQETQMKRDVLLNLLFIVSQNSTSYYNYIAFNSENEFKNFDKKGTLFLEISGYETKRNPFILFSLLSVFVVPGFYDRYFVYSAFFYDSKGIKREVSELNPVFYRQWIGVPFFIWGQFFKDREKDVILFLIDNLYSEI